MPAKIIASCFALSCFAGALLVGYAVGNQPAAIIGRAILLMFPAWVIGYIVGAIALSTLDHYLKQYQQDNPIPDETAAFNPGGKSA